MNYMNYKYLVLNSDFEYVFLYSIEELRNYIKSDFESVLFVFLIDYINGQMFLQQIVDIEFYIG